MDKHSACQNLDIFFETLNLSEKHFASSVFILSQTSAYILSALVMVMVLSGSDLG